MQDACRLLHVCMYALFLKAHARTDSSKISSGPIRVKKRSFEIRLNQSIESLSSFSSLQSICLDHPTFGFPKEVKSCIGPLHLILHFHDKRMTRIVLSRNNIDFEKKFHNACSSFIITIVNIIRKMSSETIDGDKP